MISFPCEQFLAAQIGIIIHRHNASVILVCVSLHVLFEYPSSYHPSAEGDKVSQDPKDTHLGKEGEGEHSNPLQGTGHHSSSPQMQLLASYTHTF